MPPNSSTVVIGDVSEHREITLVTHYTVHRGEAFIRSAWPGGARGASSMAASRAAAAKEQRKARMAARGGVGEVEGTRWAVLGLVIGARVVTAIQLQSVGALGPALLADPALGTDYAGLGVLIGAYMLPGVVLALPAGWLTAALGERRIVLAGLVLAAVSGFTMAAAPNFGTALLV